VVNHFREFPSCRKLIVPFCPHKEKLSAALDARAESLKIQKNVITSAREEVGKWEGEDCLSYDLKLYPNLRKLVVM